MINSFTHYLKTTIEFGNGKRFEIKNLIEEKNAKKVLHNQDQGGIIWVISREAYKSAGLS